jgi:transposase
MAGKLPVGQKELLRGKLMEMVKQGKMTLKTAAAQLKVSYRQGGRLYRAYRERGDAGLIHGSGGKPSNRKTAEAIRSRVIEQYRLRYGDFGPVFATEKLAEEGVKTSVSALRRILKGCGRRSGGAGNTAAAASRGRASGNRRGLTEARTPGLKAGGRAAA